MKKPLLQAVAALSVVASGTMAVPAGAAELSLRIPFNFVVNGATLAPGTYRVTSEGSVLLLRGWKDGAAVVTIRAVAPKDTQPGVVFYRYGDRYFLAEAWMGGTGRVVPTSRPERELIAGARRAHGDQAFERVVVPIR